MMVSWILRYWVSDGADYLYQNNLRNMGNTNGWLKVKLVGKASNRGGVGATIRAQSDGQRH